MRFIRRTIRWRRLLILAFGGALGVIVVWRVCFPYGISHCCDKELYLRLVSYAQRHGGRFPTGEVTPEASLSLICKERDLGCAGLLRGKSVPMAVTERQLAANGLLTPATCGWHYEEGLTSQDQDCGLFWDKAGLGHNGGRLWTGGHIVTFVDGRRQHIPAARWEEFLNRQAVLRNQARARQK